MGAGQHFLIIHLSYLFSIFQAALKPPTHDLGGKCTSKCMPLPAGMSSEKQMKRNQILQRKGAKAEGRKGKSNNKKHLGLKPEKIWVFLGDFASWRLCVRDSDLKFFNARSQSHRAAKGKAKTGIYLKIT